MTTPSGVVGEFKESDSAIRPMTFRRVELGYRVGLEMARQRDAERARK